MLTIFGSQRYGGFCDRVSRRDFLTIGGMALGGLALPQILRAESEHGRRSHKAIINIFLPGGPPHIDMWDMKPLAPAEIRGEFEPIATRVPGLEICELFPKLAAMADKLAIIRSLADSDGDHSAVQCMTGRKRNQQPPTGGWPAMGSWVSKLQGNFHPAVPAHLTDLEERGLERDVSVVVWGEFGRTPRLNKRNSRDHWPQANCAVLAGGGLRTGQVIGATNQYAEHPTDRPIKFQEIFATLYAKAGIDLATRAFDLRGRPQYLVDPEIEPIRELI